MICPSSGTSYSFSVKVNVTIKSCVCVLSSAPKFMQPYQWKWVKSEGIVMQFNICHLNLYYFFLLFVQTFGRTGWRRRTTTMNTMSHKLVDTRRTTLDMFEVDHYRSILTWMICPLISLTLDICVLKYKEDKQENPKKPKPNKHTDLVWYFPIFLLLFFFWMK